MHDSLGMFETVGLTPALVALDAMEKAANVRVHQSEVNDFLGVIIKILGRTADVECALAAGSCAAASMGVDPITSVLRSPDSAAWHVISSPREYNPLIRQDVVSFPHFAPADNGSSEESAVSQDPFALGFIETQGFTAVFEAIDSACKAANVDVVGKEKLGGGYVTVIIKGDVAAVKAAIEAGSSKVEGLGNLIAAHVIARVRVHPC